MSSSGIYLGDGASWLNYENKICARCGDLTRIRVSHSVKNPNRLYHWCDTHRFVDWCLPANAQTASSYQRIKEEKWKGDFRGPDVDDVKVRVKNKYWEVSASCRANSIPGMLVLVTIFILSVVISLKLIAT